MSDKAGKIDRKLLRQPDEFLTLAGRVSTWIAENREAALGLAAGIAGIVVLSGVLGWWVQRRDARSSEEFFAAIELYQRDQWSEAREGFATLTADLPSTTYGALAELYVGRAALGAGENAQAVVALEKYLGTSGLSPALTQLTRIDLGEALAATKEIDRARQMLTAATLDKGPATPEAQLALGRLEDAAGENEAALKAYGIYLEARPNGPARILARSRILALGGTLPEPAFRPGMPNISVTEG